MNLHEYQGKSLLKKYDVPVAEGILVEDPSLARAAAEELEQRTGLKIWAVKAQIHAGGRGKGGGVKIAHSLEEVEQFAHQIIGMQLVTPQTGPEGKKVRKVLVEQGIYYPGPAEPKEFYFSILLNRASLRNMILYSPRGGMNIEEVAEETPDQIFTEEIDPRVGILPFQCRHIAFNLGLNGQAYRNMVKFVPKIYQAYIESDATLLEINPLFKTSDDKILVVDTKMVIDNNALFRHPDIEAMRDIHEEDPMEVEAGQHNLSYVKLNGNVGCMVNGAGLAMATMDIIKLSGGEPANFLDVGGSANAKRVEEAFRIILKDPNVKAILVNIFGGIVRCDRVATGIVDAYKNIGEIDLPIIVRLQGTNAEEAKEIIDHSGLKVHSAILLKEAADLIRTVLKE
ncbi:MAG: ADP-forming succinate--CoA ligase subunit beta [Bacteroidales bacterium]|jgi:succinyl-CoA synthetase beta subunit|nr:ADP-forming succinate--CoA ligase subunit beta [Bacteroidales bacterium]NLM91609.1 ADP-forming succinate--CoA ligase subunit beta [Bacteroidales bacterium]